jgi:hypothetical protein
MAAALSLPGMTRNFGNPDVDLKPATVLAELAPLEERKVVLLATATITVDNMFSNGLFQNVFILYRMFEAMGHRPILVINEAPETPEKLPPMIRGCRMFTTEDVILKPLPVVALVEIGMSIDPLLREFVKMLGGKLAKLYLGNILNIDVETPIFYPSMHFAHHVIEKIDRIWVSPHYGQHAEYAAYLNHVVPPEDVSDMIAPYVWDPCFITAQESPLWKPPAAGEHTTFVTMEPNISFQKSSYMTILAVERWYRQYGKARGWKGKLVVVNGERLEQTPHFSRSVKPFLDLFKDGRVEVLERHSILAAMTKWPSAVFVGHQVNNEYNYMTLELLWCGFPVVHNAPTWAEFGYSYEGNNLAAAVAQLELASTDHASRLEPYKAHARLVAWRHSPYNPDVHKAWEELLKK